MKKILFCILILSSARPVLNNPIAIPFVYISEFTFDANNKWIIELRSGVGLNFGSNLIDSICVFTSAGYSKIRLSDVKFINNTDLFVITSDNFISPLIINKNGDKIKIISFPSQIKYYLKVDSLIFGSYPGSCIDNIDPGYSLIRIGYSPAIFCKCNKPSIGLMNPSGVGCFATLNGFMFDKNHILVRKQSFDLDNQLKVDGSGRFTTKVFSRWLRTNKIMQMGYYDVLIEPLDLNLEPDSIYEKNIYLLSDYIVSVEKNIELDFELQIRNYPNPFNSTTNFFVKIPTGLQGKAGHINIYNVNGQKIFSIELSDKSLYQWYGKDNNGKTVASGIYYYQLVIDSKSYKNGSMILLK